MKMKNALVLFGLIGFFASGFGAESSAGVKSERPQSKKLVIEDTGAGAIDEGPQAVLKEYSENGKTGLQNVILMLVDGLYQSQATAYLENQDAFPVRGLLQPCPTDNNHNLDGIGCDCEKKLGSSVASLLSWAQRVKGMSTSAIYEMPKSISGPRARLIDRKRHEAPWSLHIEPVNQNEGANIASKISDTFFRNLVNDLNVSQHRTPTLVQRSNMAEFTSSVFKEMNLMQNKSGHLAIVRIRVDKLGNVLELFKRKVSPSNTLLVVMDSCPQDHSVVPFFARGFGSERLSDVANSKLHDLPIAIRTVISESDMQTVVDTENIKPTMIFMSDNLNILEDHMTGSISTAVNQRYRRDDDAQPSDATDLKARSEGEEASKSTENVSSPIMMFTALTATITYVLKY